MARDATGRERDPGRLADRRSLLPLAVVAASVTVAGAGGSADATPSGRSPLATRTPPGYRGPVGN